VLVNSSSALLDTGGKLLVNGDNGDGLGVVQVVLGGNVYTEGKGTPTTYTILSIFLSFDIS